MPAPKPPLTAWPPLLLPSRQTAVDTTRNLATGLAKDAFKTATGMAGQMASQGVKNLQGAGRAKKPAAKKPVAKKAAAKKAAAKTAARKAPARKA